MICLFEFERFSIESRFPFLKLTLYGIFDIDTKLTTDGMFSKSGAWK